MQWTGYTGLTTVDIIVSSLVRVGWISLQAVATLFSAYFFW